MSALVVSREVIPDPIGAASNLWLFLLLLGKSRHLGDIGAMVALSARFLCDAGDYY